MKKNILGVTLGAIIASASFSSLAATSVEADVAFHAASEFDISWVPETGLNAGVNPSATKIGELTVTHVSGPAAYADVTSPNFGPQQGSDGKVIFNGKDGIAGKTINVTLPRGDANINELWGKWRFKQDGGQIQAGGSKSINLVLDGEQDIAPGTYSATFNVIASAV